MSMTIGQEVYTVNAKTNKVDFWKYAGVLRTKGELLIHLVNGKKYCFLPARCVYTSYDEALKVGNISLS